MSTSKAVIIRYLEDAEAAGRNFGDALATFGHAGEQQQVKQFFEFASKRAKTQHERLEAGLKALGGSRSTAKSILAHIPAFTRTLAQIGREPAEKNTQNLMVCIAAASAEMALEFAMTAVPG